ncbi:MAG TPA: isoprenylcysteine carboxylmethyltransferase family protein [Pilimelia sp.]|nr:isoprenylcysteine carboxylmethyltransferase family protein [Pilimelia sp.]
MRRGAAAMGSILFFVLAPGVFGALVPGWLTGGWQVRHPESYGPAPRVIGGVLVVAGTAVLLHAFARFVREGLGTPAPVAPTERLVVGGLYQHVRNPMYLAVLAVIVGQALLLAQPVLLAYAAVVALAFVVFVRAYEEPTLRRQHGARYEAYRRAVPGWWPRLRPWHPDEDHDKHPDSH